MTNNANETLKGGSSSVQSEQCGIFERNWGSWELRKDDRTNTPTCNNATLYATYVMYPTIPRFYCDTQYPIIDWMPLWYMSKHGYLGPMLHYIIGVILSPFQGSFTWSDNDNVKEVYLPTQNSVLDIGPCFWSSLIQFVTLPLWKKSTSDINWIMTQEGTREFDLWMAYVRHPFGIIILSHLHW